MPQQPRSVLSQYFLTGKTPIQGNFADLIDSTLNLKEDQVTGDQIVSLPASKITGQLSPGQLPTGAGASSGTVMGALGKKISGTVTTALSSAIVTGTGTQFTTELSPGMALKIGAEVFSISAIADDLHLTVDRNPDVAVAAAPAYCDGDLLTIMNGASSLMMKVDHDGVLNWPLKSGGTARMGSAVGIDPGQTIAISAPIGYLHCGTDNNWCLVWEPGGLVAVRDLLKVYGDLDLRGDLRIGDTEARAALTIKGNPPAPLTGTVSVQASSNIVTGSGTHFTQELAPGFAIQLDGALYVIEEVVDDTHVRVRGQHWRDQADVAAQKIRPSLMLTDAAGTCVLQADGAGNLIIGGDGQGTPPPFPPGLLTAGDVTARAFIGSGSGLNEIPAGRVQGTFNAQAVQLDAGAITGQLRPEQLPPTPAPTAPQNIDASTITSGTLANERLPAEIIATGSVTAPKFIGSGSALTELAAGHVMGVFNPQLVQLDAGAITGQLRPEQLPPTPAPTAPQDIDAATITSGTLANERLPADIPRLDSSGALLFTPDIRLSLTPGLQNNNACVFVGYQAGLVNDIAGGTGGVANTVVGNNSFQSNTVGQFNTVLGSNSLSKSVKGMCNVAVGSNALEFSLGDYNTAVGGNALYNCTGQGNTALGGSAGVNLTTGNNNIAIGHNGVAGESGIIRIGTPGWQTDTFLTGVIHGDGSGLTNLNLAAVLAGDVTGASGETVVARVGGVSAADVALAAAAANAATDASTANALVKRDANGNFSTGAIMLSRVGSCSLSVEPEVDNNWDARGLTLLAGSAYNGGTQAHSGGDVVLQAGNGFNWSIPYSGGGNAIIRSGANWTSGNKNGGFIIFQIGGPNNTFVEKMRITDKGNVGIGTSNPSAALEVNGGIKCTGPVDTTSDARFKTGVEPLMGALDLVLRFRGVSYDWKHAEFPERNFPRRRQLGFIAQEVREILPELVSEDHEGCLSIALSSIIPLLVESTKELCASTAAEKQSNAAWMKSMQQENAELRARLEVLEAKDKIREDKLAALEKLIRNGLPTAT
ncbi:MAG: tail fiber domain-containing protein [Prosthecobacter sp.]